MYTQADEHIRVYNVTGAMVSE